jgi:hypothetical protein
MQPYLFPYLGYFQLIAHADVFVVADDFPWVRRGWINRNRLLSNGESALFTFAVERRQRADDGIGVCRLAGDYAERRRGLIARLDHDYGRQAPREALELVRRMLPAERPDRLLDLLVPALQEVCAYLGITTPFVLSTERPVSGLSGEQRVIRLAERWGAGTYLNPIGGRELYHGSCFSERGVGLGFLEAELPPYPQARAKEFVPALSILDVVLSVPQERAREMARLGRIVPVGPGDPHRERGEASAPEA